LKTLRLKSINKGSISFLNLQNPQNPIVHELSEFQSDLINKFKGIRSQIDALQLKINQKFERNDLQSEPFRLTAVFFRNKDGVSFVIARNGARWFMHTKGLVEECGLESIGKMDSMVHLIWYTFGEQIPIPTPNLSLAALIQSDNETL
jgi:hypothetical protein